MNEEVKTKKEPMTSDKKEVRISDIATSRGNGLKKRDGRVPLHKQKRIRIEKEPETYYRLVSDVGNRIESFKRAGYELTGSSQSVGGGITGHFMRIPQDWHDADQAEKQLENDRIMGQIKNGFSSERPIDNQTGTVRVDDRIKK